MPLSPFKPEPPLRCFPAGRWLAGSLLLAGVMVAVVLVAGRLVGDHPTIALRGAYAVAAVQTGSNETVVRFVDEDRALVREGGSWREAVYHFEKNHVVLETVPDSGRAQVWVYAIVGDRLVDHGVILARQ